VKNTVQIKYEIMLLYYMLSVNSIQFNSRCPVLTPKATNGKKLSQHTEHVVKQKRLKFTHENVGFCYFLNGMGQAVPSFRLSIGKTAFANLQPSCQWFMTLSPGRSETDSRRDNCDSSNKIR